LLVTTNTMSDPHVAGITYDTGNYPKTSLVLGGMTFARATRVDYVYQNAGSVSPVSYTADDTALKQITVYVLWQEANEWKYQMIQNLIATPAATPLRAVADG